MKPILEQLPFLVVAFLTMILIVLTTRMTFVELNRLDAKIEAQKLIIIKLSEASKDE